MTPLRFRRVRDELDVWSASSDRYSYVISYGSPKGPGSHGRSGDLASWRQNGFAIEIIGSPFGIFANAAEACNEMLEVLNEQR
jgi:hypothetical protein